jgi:hypothetical protein
MNQPSVLGDQGPRGRATGRAPRWARRFVWVFLAAFVAAGVIGIEVWPLTGWRLFADARQQVQTGWQATAVDSEGHTEPIDFRALAAGYQGDVQVLQTFSALPAAERAAVCDAWAAALRERGRDVAEIRIYATRSDVGERDGDRGAPPARTLQHTCVDGGVQAPGADGAPP